MSKGEWNHNIHDHDAVLEAVPPHCGRALDVGCGAGILARQLAERCGRVIAIDKVRSARMVDAGPRIEFVEGDAMTYPFEPASFDLISLVATLHHLPLREALERFEGLLRPGGTLAVIGLYRMETCGDYVWGAGGKTASWFLRRGRRVADVTAPIAEPRESLGEIRAACESVLPGGGFRRRLLFRYSFIWRKQG